MTPVIGLRIGDADAFYFMAEVMESNPLIAGGGYFGYGIGIKSGSTRMSYGVTGGPYFAAIHVKWAQTLDPFLFSVSGILNPSEMHPEGDYGISLGVGYKLPGRP